MNTTVELAHHLFGRNVGAYDRPARLLVGTTLVAAGFFTSFWLSGFGLWVLFTGLVGWCPLYRLFGFSSCPVTGR